MARTDLELLLEAAKRLAAVILENGGETYRAEEAARRLCGLCGTQEIDVLALPTGVLVHMTAKDGKAYSALARVRTRRLDLGAVARANEIARRLAAGTLSPADALCELSAPQGQGKAGRLLAPALSAFSIGCFSVLMGGGVFEFFAAAACAFLSQLVCSYFRDADLYYFITSLAGGVVCALSAVLAVTLFGTGSLDVIIGSAILPLLPGMTLIGAIRDSVRGDLVSGAARLGDVLVVLLSLSFGVGAVLWCYGWIGGAL